MQEVRRWRIPRCFKKTTRVGSICKRSSQESGSIHIKKHAREVIPCTRKNIDALVIIHFHHGLLAPIIVGCSKRVGTCRKCCIVRRNGGVVGSVKQYPVRGVGCWQNGSREGSSEGRSGASKCNPVHNNSTYQSCSAHLALVPTHRSVYTTTVSALVCKWVDWSINCSDTEP